MTEPVSEHDLQAYADGKLPEDRRAAVAAWLAARPEDAERIESYRQLAEELRSTYEGVLDEPVPERLQRTVRPDRTRRFAKVAMWVAFSATLGAIAGWQLHAIQQFPAPAAESAGMMARRAAVAHATYSPEVRHPVEVGADQETHLVAWLSTPLGTQLRAPKLESVGYSLVGGKRLDWERFDTFAVPGGEWAEHVNASDREPAILFVASDEPTLKALALYQKHGRMKNGEVVRLY